MRNWPHYLARRLDRWWYGWLQLESECLCLDGYRINLTINKRDWRFKVRAVYELLKMIRIDMTVANCWTLPVWGWWNRG